MINFKKINLRSIILNFFLFPFKQAIKFPLSIESHVLIKELHRGAILLEGDISPGMLQIGYNIVGIVDAKRDRGILHISHGGKLICKGRNFIGAGCNISIGGKGNLILGENLVITARSSIICHEKIKIGKECLFSWDCLIMDTDFHKVYLNQEVINKPRSIVFGDKVWCGCRVTILKGSLIPSGSVIGANSLINRGLKQENSMYVGNPVKLIRENIIWEN